MVFKINVRVIVSVLVFFSIPLGLSAEEENNEISLAREADAEKIWAQELHIYEMRSGGDMGYYLSLASPGYMAWPAPAEAPLSFKKLSERIGGGQLMEAGELITVSKKGLSFDGDTALAFFETHRTQRAGGKAVDERFENIHVWVKRDEQWRLIANMSRAVAENRERLGNTTINHGTD